MGWSGFGTGQQQRPRGSGRGYVEGLPFCLDRVRRGRTEIGELPVVHRGNGHGFELAALGFMNGQDSNADSEITLLCHTV